MQLFSYRKNGAVRSGVVVNDGGLDVAVLERAMAAGGDDVFAESIRQPLPEATCMIDLLAAGADRLGRLAMAVDRAREAPLDGVLLSLDSIDFVVPTPGSHKILCVGRNYLEHVSEANRDVSGEPVLFCRYEDSLVAHREPLERPAVSKQLDWEGELAAIIGRRCRYVDEEDALGAVAGYAAFNDGSVRDYQFHTGQWTPGKNFLRSGSYGPYLVTSDEVPDPQDVHLETRVNTVVVQSACTATMIFSLRRIISYISMWTELRPGDVIATGTPAGVGGARTPKWFLEPGDQVSVSIAGIGILSNPIVQGEGPD